MNKPHRPGAEEWRQVVDGQQASGLTVAAYCHERGVAQGSFYTWKRRLRAAPPACAKRLPTPAFVEVKPMSLSAGGAIEIHLSGERRLLVRRGFDRDLLIELVRTLEGAA